MAHRPKARTAGLIAERLIDEVMLYDTARHRAVCLNQSASLVWRLADGQTDVEGIAARVAAELDVPADRGLVSYALDQLARHELLEGPPPDRGSSRISRRQLMRRLGIGIALVPAVTAIVAPTAAQAQSGPPPPGPTGPTGATGPTGPTGPIG